MKETILKIFFAIVQIHRPKRTPLPATILRIALSDNRKREKEREREREEASKVRRVKLLKVRISFDCSVSIASTKQLAQTHLWIAIPLLNRRRLWKLRSTEAPRASAGRIFCHDLRHQVRRNAWMIQRVNRFDRGVLILLPLLLYRLEKNVETIWKNEKEKR